MTDAALSANPPSPAASFLAGTRDTVPMLIGAAPFGVIFGTLAVGNGLSPLLTMMMSLLVFAGSSQFVAVSLIGGGVTLPVIWLTTFIVNLRHALYSATLLPYARHMPLRWRWLFSCIGLTDETFAVVEYRFRNGLQHGKRAYWLGSALSMYGNWQVWTLVGITLGKAIPDIGRWGLDFGMLATFAAIVAPQLKQRPALAAAVVASLLAWFGRNLPYRLDLLLAVAGGVMTGMLAEQFKHKAQQP